jgi:Arc/MetJ-type ribon-helix-helix transcriptional regulator
MKTKISVSMDEKLVKQAKNVVDEGRFRNKSHLIEYALKTFLKKKNVR